jgi:hypothetical protein
MEASKIVAELGFSFGTWLFGTQWYTLYVFHAGTNVYLPLIMHALGSNGCALFLVQDVKCQGCFNM